MIRPFQFAKLPLIIFGPGKRSELPRFVRKYGTRIVLVTRGRSLMKTELFKSLLAALDKQCVTSLHVVISSEPSPVTVDDAVRKSAEFKPDAVVGIGGGSVLDAAKAISAMIPVEGSVEDYLEGVGTREHSGNKIPFIAVPTTSGTGSEATKNAVISRIGINGFKKSLRHDNFVPDVAIVDPELTLSCPPELTAASGMDCFTQLTEAYLSDKSNEYTDALAFEGLRAVSTSLLRSYQDGSDIEARTGMSFAALTSGICLANAGLGIVHGFASSIGGMYNIPHGVICGTLMGTSNEATVNKLREKKDRQVFLEKYARLGKLFTGKDQSDDSHYIDAFIGYLNEMTDMLHLPGLKELGIEKADLEKISEATECKNNPVRLDSKELTGILLKRFI